MPNFFASVPKGLESLLLDELITLGASETKETVAGAYFKGSFETAYNCCLRSRLASRVFSPLLTTPVSTTEELYEQVRGIPWEEHMTVDTSFAVNATLSNSRITHSQFAALKVKDGIVDYFRDRLGRRPSVKTVHPELQLNLTIKHNQAILSVDLSGESLHQRGYRTKGGKAPIKETLAAALLLRAGWPQVFEEGGILIDPMCGSGTILIEAVLMALKIPPGFLRDYYGMFGWKQFDEELWARVIKEVQADQKSALQRDGVIAVGSDVNSKILVQCKKHIAVAGVERFIDISRVPISQFSRNPEHTKGILVTNPPYGERLGDIPALAGLYATFGQVLQNNFEGWKAAVLCSDLTLGKLMGLRTPKKYKFFNGSIPCHLLVFDLKQKNFFDHQEFLETYDGGKIGLGESAVMFRNRLRKNLKRLKSWVKREGIGCYRVYDADMPEFNVAIDVYIDYLVIQEYRAPSTVPPQQAARRLLEVLLVAPEVTGIHRNQVMLKVRQHQHGKEQYSKMNAKGDTLAVREGGCRFWVNLTDYLDTGLFLDHRLTRKHIGSLAKDTRFLNLFAYTGSATVYAAKGGARSTLTVDMSNNYLAWAERNMELNKFQGKEHRYVKADCLEWLNYARGVFDLIFLDPPSFSNSRSMARTFDVQRDYVELINKTIKLLAPGGTLIFSTNLRGFKMDCQAFSGCLLTDISKKTIPFDFKRRSNIHQCWSFTKNQTGNGSKAGKRP